MNLKLLLPITLLVQGCTSNPPLPREPDLTGIDYTVVFHKKETSYNYQRTLTDRSESPITYGFLTMVGDRYYIHILDHGEWENKCTEIHEKWHIVDYPWHIGEFNDSCGPDYSYTYIGE